MTDADDAVAALWDEVGPQQRQLAEQLLGHARAAASDQDDEEAWQQVRSIAHRLAGTLGSFGQRAAGDAAVTIEEVTGEVDQPDQDLADRVVTLSEAIVTALRAEG